MRHSCVLLLVAFASFCAALPAETVLYVAPSGNDAVTGSADAPLATLDGALAKLRARDVKDAARVIVRGGTYPLAAPVTFGPEDSGALDAPVVIEAAPGETPVFDGGRRITGWRQEGAFWVADVPFANEIPDLNTFWVNGKRRQPARTPNCAYEAGDFPVDSEFFYTDGAVMEKGADGKEEKSSTKLRFRAGDIQNWASIKDATVVVFHSWATSLHRVANLDEANRVLEFTGPARWCFNYWRPDQWYFVEHLFEALDVPGEWFFNREQSKLYYIPFPDEDMTAADAVVAAPMQLLLVEGKPSEGAFVSYLTFRGLTFQYATQPIGPGGFSDSQAEATLPATLQFTGARHCRIENCTLRHAGNYGLWFRAGCRDNALVHSELTDLGAGGVRIGECASAPSPNEECRDNLVENCFLHDGGRMFRSAVGVFIARSSYNTVTHCEVCDFRYSGFSVGWSWGYDASSAHHNTISYNRIHDCGKGQLSDMGGIYTLGISTGTVLRNNYIYDIISNRKLSGGWGLYTDEGSTDILLENNIVYHTTTGTVHQHYGRENRFTNNILAFSETEQLIRSRQEEHLSFFMDTNIIVSANGRLLGSNWSNGNYRLDNNLYWDIYGHALTFAGKDLAEWQAGGYDTHSIIADPMFEDLSGRDFRLKPDSPALKMGFKPIDAAEIGLYGDADWTAKPGAIPREALYVPPAPEMPAPIADGFEDTAPGEPAKEAQSNEEGDSATIRVTEETAATGAHSLKFTDAAGLKRAFDPHLVYSPHFALGNAVGSFALRVQPGIAMYYEWRDAHDPYRTGPSVWFNGDGVVTVNGKQLAAIPVGAWSEVEVSCMLGQAADGTWAMTLTLPDGAKQHWDGLTCNPGFKHLDWLGFVANSDASATAEIDDVRIETVTK